MNQQADTKTLVKEIIGQLTLDEKCSMFSGKNFWETVDIPRLNIPSIFLADGPHGIRKQAKAADHLGLNESIKATCFPTSATTANSFDIALGEEIGTALGEEAVYQKVNILLGPGLNIKRNPLCGRNFEYYSEDPYLAGHMSASYVRGIQKSGISACLKHYAANNQEYRRMLVDTIVDERTLREIYLTNFEIGVKEGGAKTVMAAYNKLNGVYTNECNHILREVLRDDWGFKGLVVSDWGGQNDRVAAIKAGAELEMPSSKGQTSLEVLLAVENGELDIKYVDECIERLLTIVFDTEKVFEEKKQTGFQEFDKDKHHALALRAAEESIVLLENKNNALPLKQGEKVAIIGDFAKTSRYQGAGSSGVNPTKVDNTLEMLGNYDFEYVGFEPGFKRFGQKGNAGLIKKALMLANQADTVIVYLGLDELIETEGLDRQNMKLSEGQTDLLRALKETGKKIIGVISSGAALEINFDQYCDALIHAYLFGQAGASAVLNIITGKVSPSGKLAESYPIKYADCPSASNFPESFHSEEQKYSKNVEYREGIFVGYRYYNTAGVAVKYPFGYGLSYTTFKYSDLKVNPDGVTFKLTNTGSVKGKEVCQMYIGLPESKIFRAKKELKGFTKVELEPGETKEVKIPFDEYSFRYFNVKTNKWEVERGKYDVMISACSLDECVQLKGSVEKKATTDDLPYVGLELPSYSEGKVEKVSKEEFEVLYGKELPDSNYPFEGKNMNRMRVDYNTGIMELRWARTHWGRSLARVMRGVHKLLKGLGMHKMANMLTLNLFNMPLRGFCRFGAFGTPMVDTLIALFNGELRKTKAERKAKKALYMANLYRVMPAGKKRDKMAMKAAKMAGNVPVVASEPQNTVEGDM